MDTFSIWLNSMIRITFWLLYLFGWLLLCIFKYRKWNIRKKRCTKTVHAKVVSVLEKKPMRGSDMLYKPVFQVTLDDQLVTIRSAYFSNLIHFETGEQVELLVNPENYQQFLYKTEALNRGKAADIICCILPLFFAIGILCLSKL